MFLLPPSHLYPVVSILVLPVAAVAPKKGLGKRRGPSVVVEYWSIASVLVINFKPPFLFLLHPNAPP